MFLIKKNSAKLLQQISSPHSTCDEVVAGTVGNSAQSLQKSVQMYKKEELDQDALAARMKAIFKQDAFGWQLEIRAADAMMLDTVEKNMEGLAQKIILEDEQRRAQELVRGRCTSNYVGSPAPRYRMYSTLHRNGRTGI